MTKTQVSCPNCHQPVVADVDQLFDVNADPSAKQRLLSGAFNLIQCNLCGYQGNLSTILVYHDPEKELLLTFVPPEIGLPRNEQERVIGGLINQVINKLPQEKRKGYLLNPQATLTLQGLIERVLEGDGITHEMIQAQQQRLSLLQRLATTSDESVRVEIIKQEDAMLDQDFFMLLNRLGEASMSSGDRESARQLAELQKSLLANSTYGHQLQEQSKEIETALADLQKEGKDLTREKMLELVVHAPNETRLSALVGLARPLLDYSFFQLLSERIDRARGDGRARLVELRSHLLEMTQEIDKQIETQRKQIRQLINAILQAPDIEQALAKALPAIDEVFESEIESMLQEARQQGDLDRSGKLQKIIEMVQKASAAPPEMGLVEDYLDITDDEARKQFLQNHQDQVDEGFMELLANLAVQTQSGQDKELAAQVMAANRQAIRFVMQRNLRSG
jgi:CpXC protein